MVGLIFGIILLVVGLGLAAYFATHKVTKYQTDRWGDKVKGEDGQYIGTTSTPYKKFSLLTAIIAVVLCVLLVFLGCIASVPTGHTGVVTTFGRVEADVGLLTHIGGGTYLVAAADGPAVIQQVQAGIGGQHIHIGIWFLLCLLL